MVIDEQNIDILESDNELAHYGTKFHSGRYPWGSGDEPYQHSGDFVSRVHELRKEGMNDTDIAKYFSMSTTDFRNEYKAAKNERRTLMIQQAKGLKEKGYSNYKIAEIMNLPRESSVRSLLDPNAEARMLEAKKTYEFLKEQISNQKMVDVGEGVERDLNISRGKLDEAIYMMKMEGYEVYDRYIDNQTNPGKQLTVKTICKPGTTYEEFIKTPLNEIGTVTDFTSQDDGQSFKPKNVYPKSMSSDRLQIRYAEDGGTEKDGIIELRRGVEDLSLGNDVYAQVRILVDNNRYLKGVAVYSDNMPDGVDVVFNTNKTKDVSKMDVLKKCKTTKDENGNTIIDPDNPFGSSIKEIEKGGQHYYKDKDGNDQLSLINKRASEGDWKEWSNNLPSQFLSKQPRPLAKKQLQLAIDGKMDEFNEICALTNPTVKKELLKSFAEDCDSAAVHLKAAALPRQQYHVIIPINSLKDTEVYAPNYKDGEKVCLIRYPHGGTFEIPELTVNNKNVTANKLLGKNIVDAVGINAKVAERLSGADFDGDTVMVIPVNDKVRIKSTPALEGLKGFDPKLAYATKEVNGKYCRDDGTEVKIMRNTQNEMGRISNLITDMTLLGATNDELARAVRHSMVVIDAEKHKLDYKRSEIENDILSLKNKYQKTVDEETGAVRGGASTIISRAKSQESVLKRQGTPKINIKGSKDYDPSKPEGSLIYKLADDKNLYKPDTIKDPNNPKKTIGYRLADGKKVTFDPNDKDAYGYYKPVLKKDEATGEVYYTNKTGELKYKTVTKTQKSTKMAETDDAYSLVSKENNPMEQLYANYANKMKSLANEARKEYATTGEIEYSPSANNTYKNEVNSLLTRLNDAAKNQTRERRAQLLAGSQVNAKIKNNPDMTKEEIKKFKQQATERARAKVGAKRNLIEISDREWEAIQAGAISKTKLKDILKYSDMESVRSKAMPRKTTTLSNAQVNRIQSMMNSGRYTTQEIATALGVSVSTINNYTKGKE